MLKIKKRKTEISLQAQSSSIDNISEQEIPAHSKLEKRERERVRKRA